MSQQLPASSSPTHWNCLSTFLPSTTLYYSSLSQFPSFSVIQRYLSYLSFTMAPLFQVSSRIQEVRDLAKEDPSKAASNYQKILSEGPGSTEASSRDYEHALIGLGQVYRDGKKPQEIADLIKTSRDTFSSFAKAKTAKLGKIQPSNYR